MQDMTSQIPSRRSKKAPPAGETGRVTVKLRDGESVTGWIEYFDDTMIRITREGRPNLFIYKHQIRSISERGQRETSRNINGEERSAR
jgi:host factor-I protein